MNSKRPIIGIPGSKIKKNNFGVPISYMEYASFFGTPRILSMEEEVDDRIDLLIIPGGPDVNPVRYERMPGYYTSKPDLMKEYFDTQIMPQYIKAGIPIFGICRGIQTIAVHFGAMLVQHISNHPYSTVSRSEAAHTISLVDNSFKKEFESEYGNKKIEVNSLHHQCVSNNSFPKELEILGIYNKKDESTIEVLRHRTLPIYGLQYHPEELTKDPLGDFIINKLLIWKELQMEIEFAKVAYS